MYEELEQKFNELDNKQLTEYLKETYNIMKFQCHMIIELYRKLEKYRVNNGVSEYERQQKEKIFKRITNGDINSKETIELMARQHCKKMLLRKDAAIDFLITTCDMSLDKAMNFYNAYMKAERYENQMLSEEVDTGMIALQKETMIDEIFQKVIDKNKVIKKVL